MGGEGGCEGGWNSYNLGISCNHDEVLFIALCLL